MQSHFRNSLKNDRRIMGYLTWKIRPSPPKVAVHSLGLVRKRQLCGLDGCQIASVRIASVFEYSSKLN